MSGQRPAIELVELTKRYGRTVALDGLSMRVERGEVFGFLGPNGAGKTTAVKLLLGLARPTSGGGTVLGHRLGDREVRRRVGYLPELFRYQPWLRAREVLAVHCELMHLPRPDWQREVTQALGTVGLAERGDDAVGTFSKGMQQRLGLGVALLGRPELVVLDEPTSALDPVGRTDVRSIIREATAAGTTVFLNSHLLTEVERVCDRIAIVDRGHVVAAGTLDGLLGEPSVRVRVSAFDAGRLPALGDRFGLPAIEEDRLVFRPFDLSRVPDLVSALVGMGARIHAVEPGRETLEDRFIALVRGREGTGGPEPGEAPDGGASGTARAASAR